MKRRQYFWIFIAFLLLLWLAFILYRGYSLYNIYVFGWPLAITMFIGAFIAGATAEGGGAVAFPVMTLLLSISPIDARVFSLGCQSFGMTSASAFILSNKIPIIKKCIVPVCASGIIGFIIGDCLLINFISPIATKLFFVSLWISFGFALWLINKNKSVIKNMDLPAVLTLNQIVLFCVFGFIGGNMSAIFGNGIDMVTFTLLTLYFRIDEKVATPTSVIIMSVITVFGFMWHIFIREDVSLSVEYFLLAAIPVCILMAPLGAFVISKLSRKVIANFLYCVIISQFITAIWVVKPSMNYLLFCAGIIAVGSILFFIISKKAGNVQKNKN